MDSYQGTAILRTKWVFSKSATSMLITDIDDGLYWWQLWDVDDRIFDKIIMTLSTTSENFDHHKVTNSTLSPIWILLSNTGQFTTSHFWPKPFRPNLPESSSVESFLKQRRFVIHSIVTSDSLTHLVDYQAIICFFIIFLSAA